jgi:PTS system nitrogen regulatory IIA component
MNLYEYLDDDLVCELSNDFDKQSLLKNLVEVLKEKRLLQDPKEAYNALLEREKLGSTAVGEEVAIPHAKLKSVDDLIILLAVSRNGVDFESLDNQPVKIFFLVLAPVKKMNLHLKTLARISRLIKSTNFKERVLKSQSKDEILEILKEEESKL